VNHLHVMPSVDPNGGGPIEGVRQIGLRLRALGHETEVVTMDPPDAPYLKDFPLTVHAMGPGAGNYGYTPRLVPWLKANAANYDGIVVNGLWQYHSLAAWRALRETGQPYVAYTHGMLDPWFKRAYPLKHLKKWLYWPWGDYRVLRDAAAVLFTCEDERLLARQSFWLYQAREVVTGYGTKTPPQDAERLKAVFLARYPDLQGRRLLLFLSRIHAKKGCDLLIDAFARAAASDPRLHLVMAGPDQTGWAAELKAQAQALGVADRITWPGMLQGDVKWGAFYASEAFVLPSHQENFGIAVAESLACGLPVLISDKVNIWREVQWAGAGFVAPDTREGAYETLRRWLDLAPEQRLEMAAAGRRLFAEQFSVERMADSLLHTLQRVQTHAATARAGGASQPAEDTGEVELASGRDAPM